MSAGDTSALDLDAIEARANAASAGPWAADPCQGEIAVIAGGPVSLVVPWRSDRSALGDCAFIAHARQDVPALVAEVRRLRALHEAAAQAFDDLVALAWRAATGEDHEGPASVDDLIVTLTALRSSHRERSEALLTMTRRALDAERLLDATEGTEREEDLARQIRAAARREGAEAMREACAEECEARAVERGSNELAHAATALRALPLPEVTP